MRNLPLKQAKSMMVRKVSWRKVPRPEKGVAICTRLILPDAIPAVKEYGFQRGSERTICSTKWNAYSILDTCPNTVGIFLFLTPYWVAK